MKIKKINNEVVYSRRIENYDIDIENSKGEKMEVVYQTYTEYDPDFGVYESDDKFFLKGEDITDETILNDFLGDDYDDFIDELSELIKE